jgi:hypothetical protein
MQLDPCYVNLAKCALNYRSQRIPNNYHVISVQLDKNTRDKYRCFITLCQYFRSLRPASWLGGQNVY